MNWEQDVWEENLEIENRMKNLFWTICGDYSIDIVPDVESFRRSKYVAMYDAIKTGAFQKYFQMSQLQEYLFRQQQNGIPVERLIELTQLCVDLAVYPRINKDRLGIPEIRKRAFTDHLKQKQWKTSLLTQVKRYYMQTCLHEVPDEPADELLQLYRIIKKAETACDTKELIRVVDEAGQFLYTSAGTALTADAQQYIKGTWFDITESAWQECMTDEEMEKILEDYRFKLSKNILSLDQNDDEKTLYQIKKDKQIKWIDNPKDHAARKKVVSYIEMNYGKSYLNANEQLAVNRRFCKGIHEDCSLHLTEGILHSADLKNNAFRFSQMQFEKNRLYYYGSHWIVKRNIADLADTLKKTLALRQEESLRKAKSGKIMPKALWKVNRTEEQKLFRKREIIDDSEFVVDILLDSSGSQSKRQPQVAIQGYIISAALSAVGIPHRVSGYCTFWDHTVLQRYRDYEDAPDKDMRTFEFRASGNNRDGLVLQVACDSLKNRPEENKILIVLSDGKPLDMGVNRPGTGNPSLYLGDDAVRDTAKEVRRARAEGIAVLGVFAGDPEELAAEKKIYGKDFVFIRKMEGFARAVGIYLKKQIES